eukprot:CAMPEP_0114339916 /NCGR_PEP_ID=MMETSP0101-20121206/8036_1 /TAXON_ID=38822 ORGANISM="Pteridomonas danica, Strain PT" /NCGR_SAMPLE_ID=MMETSP0101 /ASSEMBLY_ACC=CAM_ASM_000211 /LENGTH=358 /DNA_ID=CAMNT_0001473019 /DNA_START=13 /DNA_END=1089 /DNA_ORIENTATION=+
MARLVLGGTTVAIGSTMALCMFDRHGPPGASSKLDRYLNPPLHLIAGVTFVVSLTEAFVSSLFLISGKTLSITTDNDIDLKQMVMKTKSTSPVIVAANHNTYLDAPLLAPLFGRCGTNLSFLWIRDPSSWIFSAGSASLLFSKPIMGTITSLVCGLPIQQKWITKGESHPKDLISLNVSQHLNDFITCLKSGKTLLFFPEGRLIQNSVEVRDEEGRWTQMDGRKNEPNGLVATFHSGVGRLVAHSGAKVIPTAHCGLDSLLTSEKSYNLVDVSFDLSPHEPVSVHVGEPIDFTEMIQQFEKKHPNLTPFSNPQALGCEDYMCDEKRKFYREITEVIRAEIIRCHNTAREASSKQKIKK